MNTLHLETLALAKKYVAEANRLDREYLESADPRAVQGGAFDWDARHLRELAKKLIAIATEAEEYQP